LLGSLRISSKIGPWRYRQDIDLAPLTVRERELDRGSDRWLSQLDSNRSPCHRRRLMRADRSEPAVRRPELDPSLPGVHRDG
jgi:hypothetical protein